MRVLIKVVRILVLLTLVCSAQHLRAQVITGAERTGEWLPSLKGKNVALVVNHTSLVGQRHLLDTMLSLGIRVTKIFAPEHGFRGNHSAGAKVASTIDSATGIAVVSLYGNKRKPSREQMAGLQYVVFDIQDVGARFYTYISTMHYAMEACAENSIPMMVLDRPNPNGHYVDGPVLDTAFKSFVGMHPVPVVHGLTVGEYAKMINGEKWLAGKRTCSLKVIPCLNYNHDFLYQLPVNPSPNLPNMASIYLYPSICFFEGTRVSLGRGTPWPFQIIGYPEFQDGNIDFTPLSIPGVAENPPYLNQKCKGIKLDEFGRNVMPARGSLYLFWILEMYRTYPEKEKFFTDFFEKLAGTRVLRQQIEKGLSEEEIRETWKPGLKKYMEIRKKYLLYPDFSE